MTACEAAWHISAYPMHGSSHIVSTVYVHRPFEEPVFFKPGEEEVSFLNSFKNDDFVFI